MSVGNLRKMIDDLRDRVADHPWYGNSEISNEDLARTIAFIFATAVENPAQIPGCVETAEELATLLYGKERPTVAEIVAKHKRDYPLPGGG